MINCVNVFKQTAARPIWPRFIDQVNDPDGLLLIAWFESRAIPERFPKREKILGKEQQQDWAAP
jgi:hypothetical protein